MLASSTRRARVGPTRAGGCCAACRRRSGSPCSRCCSAASPSRSTSGSSATRSRSSRPSRSRGTSWPSAFFAAELKVVDVHFRREKHSFSLSEFPAVIGFFLLSPTDYFLAMLVGDRGRAPHPQPGAAEDGLQPGQLRVRGGGRPVGVLRAPDHDGVPDPDDWAAAFAATSIAAVISAVSHRDRDLRVGRRAPVREAAGDDPVRRPGRDRQHQPRAARRVRAVARPAAARAAGRPAAHRVPGLPGVHLRAREARTPRAALPVQPDPAALARARFGARRPARARPRDVPRRARRGAAVAARRPVVGGPADGLRAGPRRPG